MPGVNSFQLRPTGNRAGASTSHAGSTLNAALRDVPRSSDKFHIRTGECRVRSRAGGKRTLPGTPITADLLVDELAFSFTLSHVGQSSPDKSLVDGSEDFEHSTWY